MGKTMNINTLVLILMFMLLPIDMVNGILLKNNINLPLSLAQFHKVIIIFFIFASFLYKPNKLTLCLGLFLLLLIPSLFQVLIQFKGSFLLNDTIKITRYLASVFAFLFFVDYVKKGNGFNLLFKLVKFSYIIFSINILLKYFGFGYPMYSFNNVGSKGFFFAGNETSVILIILSSIIGYKLWLNHDVKRYFLFFLFTMFIGFTISSKTGMLGVIIAFLLMPVKLDRLKFSTKKMIRMLFVVLFLIPILIIIGAKVLVNSPIFLRFEFFWKKLDFVTFIFSHRNKFFADGLKIYIEKYNFIEKLIGVGQTRYEMLNGNTIIEIDAVDIFFAYGFLGFSLFILLIVFIWLQARRLREIGSYPYAGFVALMILILLGISTIAGHVYSSGMAAMFLGLLFSLMYIKKNQIEN